MTGRTLIVVVGIVFAVFIGGWAVSSNPFTAIPPIGRDLPKDFRAADAIFKERVAREFPLPVSDSRIVADLELQGFDVSTEWTVYEPRSSPCLLRWRISWETKQGDMVSMIPVYGALCP